MKPIIFSILISLCMGCKKNESTYFDNSKRQDIASHVSDADHASRDKEDMAKADSREVDNHSWISDEACLANKSTFLRMRVKALLGEKGPVPYMEIRDKMWMLGEDGLKDMRGTEAWKKLQDRDTKNESQHDPMGRFGSVVSNFIFHHEDYPPNMRFRLAHLALVRINTPSLEGKPLIQDLLVFPKSAGNSIVPLEDIISSTCGRNICEMPQLSSEYFEFADQWIKEHPLLDGP